MVGGSSTTGSAQGRTQRDRYRICQKIGGLIVFFAFALSRYFYYARGVRFDTSTIGSASQLLDRVLLRSQLGESLLYLHAQPPLYNLLTGLALKLAPNEPDRLLWPVFLLAGVYSALCLYLLLTRWLVPPLLAGFLVGLLAASPAFVLYENWYFYPHLDVAWLLGSVVWLASSEGRPGFRLTVSAAHLVGLSLTRSLFHPLFYVLAAVLTVALVAPGERRRAALNFAVPGSLLAAWCLKNLLIFGFLGTSSWAARNFAGTTSDLLGATRIEMEVARGALSPAGALQAFESPSTNIRVFGLVDRHTGVAALDQEHKTHSRSLNYNHWSIPATAHYYAADNRRLIAAYPVTFLRGLINDSAPLFFSAVDADKFVAGNRSRIANLAAYADSVDQSLISRWLVGLGLLFAAACTPIIARGSRTSWALAFLSIAWVVAVGIAGDHGENYRFRYKVLWLGWGLAAAGYANAIRQRRALAVLFVGLAKGLRRSLVRPVTIAGLSAALLLLSIGAWFASARLRDRFSVSASGSPANGGSAAAERAVDGNPTTEWLAPEGDAPWLEVNFIRPTPVQGLRIINARHAPAKDRGTRTLVLDWFAGEHRAGHTEVTLRPPTSSHQTERLEINRAAVTRIRLTARDHYGQGAGLAEVVVLEGSH
ncbi:MAG TPA: discoidin domain-containing protein [Polyangiaceae bacterium]|nr:discoidin domain-containing protein [Polyangiaceae bacterium]